MTQNTGYPFGTKTRTVRGVYELFRAHELVKSYGITCSWGKRSEDEQLALPHVHWDFGDRDGYDRGGSHGNVDTALPMKPGKPSQLVTTRAMWTRRASADLTLYSSESFDVERLIEIVVSALEALCVSSGNYQIEGGAPASRDGVADAADAYRLAVVFPIPLLRLQRRVENEATSFTEETHVGNS